MSTFSSLMQGAGSRAGAQHESAKTRQQGEEERVLVRMLDQTRSNLSTLNLFMSSLTDALHKHDPLPPWEDVMASLKAIDKSLRTVRSTFSQSRVQLDSVHVYPMPNFPPERENVRATLMRKTLDPTAEEMIRAGKDAGHEYEQTRDPQEFKDMLDWATEFVVGDFFTHPWNADFTEQELKAGWKTVQTGLTRTSRLNHEWEGHEDDDDDDSSDDQGEDEIVAEASDAQRFNPPELDVIMRSLTKGQPIAQAANPPGAP